MLLATVLGAGAQAERAAEEGGGMSELTDDEAIESLTELRDSDRVTLPERDALECAISALTQRAWADIPE